MITTAATVPQPVITRRKENVVIVGKQAPASTFKSFNDLFEQMQVKFSSSESRIIPASPMDEEDIFVSPIKRTITVKAKFVVSGRIIQPPIDDEDEIYFDE